MSFEVIRNAKETGNGCRSSSLSDGSETNAVVRVDHLEVDLDYKNKTTKDLGLLQGYLIPLTNKIPPSFDEIGSDTQRLSTLSVDPRTFAEGLIRCRTIGFEKPVIESSMRIRTASRIEINGPLYRKEREVDSPIVCTYVKYPMYSEIPVEVMVRQIHGPNDLFKIQTGGILIPNKPRNSSAEYECTATTGDGTVIIAQKPFYAVFTKHISLRIEPDGEKHYLFLGKPWPVRCFVVPEEYMELNGEEPHWVMTTVRGSQTYEIHNQWLVQISRFQDIPPGEMKVTCSMDSFPDLEPVSTSVRIFLQPKLSLIPNRIEFWDSESLSYTCQVVNTHGNFVGSSEGAQLRYIRGLPNAALHGEKVFTQNTNRDGIGLYSCEYIIMDNVFKIFFPLITHETEELVENCDYRVTGVDGMHENWEGNISCHFLNENLRANIPVDLFKLKHISGARYNIRGKLQPVLFPVFNMVQRDELLYSLCFNPSMHLRRSVRLIAFVNSEVTTTPYLSENNMTLGRFISYARLPKRDGLYKIKLSCMMQALLPPHLPLGEDFYTVLITPINQTIGLTLVPRRNYVHPDESVVFKLELTPSNMPPLIRRRLEAYFSPKVVILGESAYYHRGHSLYPRHRMLSGVGKNVTIDIWAYFFYSTIRIHMNYTFSVLAASATVAVLPTRPSLSDRHLRCLLFDWLSTEKLIPGRWFVVQDEFGVYKSEGASLKFQRSPPRKVSLIYKCCGTYHGQDIWTSIQLVLDRTNFSFMATPQWIVVFQGTDQRIIFNSKEFFGSDVDRIIWSVEPSISNQDQLVKFDLSEQQKIVEIQPMAQDVSSRFMLAVRCNGSERRQTDSVVFDPPNGKIHVGDRTEFKCVRQPNEDTKTNSNNWTDGSAYFRLTDLTNRTDLLSTRNGELFGSVLPPKWMMEYKTAGSTVVRCEYIRDGETKAATELHVHILREFNLVNICYTELSRNSFSVSIREH
ncbi:hypothetical protein FBUS_09400 [Fasciolopsis buskii]|uniref:Uncharacterized protein n=1 Tax=Fasciolopsis buskii TaxID=27845 RepID=A0A8E0RJW1_9TREM|nr:hypothetical protein FBUS_09400 [Fasciolopsis buski]